jgi:hypothetical protein
MDRHACRHGGGTIMAVPSGAIRQWQSLPFPIQMAGIFLAGMAMIWLTSWLGGISVLVALLLWCDADGRKLSKPSSSHG